MRGARRRLRMALITLAVAATSSIPTTASAQGLIEDPCTDTDVQPTADEVTIPSDAYPSIQSGVCGLADGGTLHLLPGVYEGPILIWGKDIRIAGEGAAEDWPTIQMPQPTVVAAPESAVGVITVGPGGSLEVDKARIVGGDAGILGLPTAGSIDVKHVVLSANGRGILHLSNDELTVKHFVIEDTLWNGISLAPVNLEAEACKEVNVKHGLLGAQGGAGIYIRGCIAGDGVLQFKGHQIQDVTLLDPQGGGIVTIGTIVEIDDVFIPAARYWGVLLVNTLATVRRSTILGIDAGPIFNPDTGQFDERFGDGITILSTNDPSTLGAFPPPSHVDAEDNFIFGVDRAGLALFGGSAVLKDNVFWRADFELEGEDNEGYPYVFENRGGNLCGDPPVESCVAVSSNLEPPDLAGTGE